MQRRFDPARIKCYVLASQRRRLFLPSTLVKGAYTPRKPSDSWTPEFDTNRCKWSAMQNLQPVVS
jgi:hypothetical protein